MVHWVPERITLFHLYRRDGRELYLHPFDDPQVMLSLREGVEVVGKYGKEPRMEGVTAFRRQLYSGIDKAVKHWAREKWLMSNFLISAGFFVGVYLLVVLGVGLVLPAWADVGTAMAAAGIVYLLLVRRSEQSAEAEEKREYLQGKIDRIRFREDEFVKEVEERLHRSESIGSEQLLESIVSPQERMFSSRDIEDARQLLGYLERRFSAKGYRRQERILMQYRQKGKPRLRRIVNAARRDELDLSLFAMYRSLKERFEVSGSAGRPGSQQG
jgi:hypothetical protein